MSAATITAILGIVLGFLEALPRLISAGVDVVQRSKELATLLKKLRDENRDPSPEEWEAMHALCRVDEDRLQSDTDDMQQVS